MNLNTQKNSFNEASKIFSIERLKANQEILSDLKNTVKEEENAKKEGKEAPYPNSREIIEYLSESVVEALEKIAPNELKQLEKKSKTFLNNPTNAKKFFDYLDQIIRSTQGPNVKMKDLQEIMNIDIRENNNIILSSELSNLTLEEFINKNEHIQSSEKTIEQLSRTFTAKPELVKKFRTESINMFELMGAKANIKEQHQPLKSLLLNNIDNYINQEAASISKFAEALKEDIKFSRSEYLIEDLQSMENKIISMTKQNPDSYTKYKNEINDFISESLLGNESNFAYQLLKDKATQYELENLKELFSELLENKLTNQTNLNSEYKPFSEENRKKKQSLVSAFDEQLKKDNQIYKSRKGKEISELSYQKSKEILNQLIEATKTEIQLLEMPEINKRMGQISRPNYNLESGTSRQSSLSYMEKLSQLGPEMKLEALLGLMVFKDSTSISVPNDLTLKGFINKYRDKPNETIKDLLQEGRVKADLVSHFIARAIKVYEIIGGELKYQTSLSL